MRRLLILLPAMAILLVGCNQAAEHRPLSTIQPRNAVTSSTTTAEQSANRFWGMGSHGIMAAVDTGPSFDSYSKFSVAERVTYDLGINLHEIAEGRQVRDDNYALPNKSRPLDIVDPVPNNITDRTPILHDSNTTMPENRVFDFDNDYANDFDNDKVRSTTPATVPDVVPDVVPDKVPNARA